MKKLSVTLFEITWKSGKNFSDYRKVEDWLDSLGSERYAYERIRQALQNNSDHRIPTSDWYDDIGALNKIFRSSTFDGLSYDGEKQIISLMLLQHQIYTNHNINHTRSNITWNDEIYYFPTFHFQNKLIPFSWKQLTEREPYGLLFDPSDWKLERIGENKYEQYLTRHSKIQLLTENRSSQLEVAKTWLYTVAEDIVEKWALRNNLDYFDYNISNQYAPQDCQISGIDIDVKTTIGFGSRHQKNFYRYKSEKDKKENINEIIIGISSYIENPIIDKIRSPQSSAKSSHYILGVFDPKLYSSINLELKYFKPTNNLLNACYFQSLDSYFNIPSKVEFKKRKYDKKIIDLLTSESLKHYYGYSWAWGEDSWRDGSESLDSLYYSRDNFDPWVFTANCDSFLTPIIYLLLDHPKKLGDYVKSLLPEKNHDLIPTIVELATKQKIQLFPHYLADYILDKIINKEAIDLAIIPALFSLIIASDYNRTDAMFYLRNLLKLATILPDVRCKWHPEETIRDMDIEYFHNSYVPTVLVKCSQNPYYKTTIFTYSWKTGETLIYGDNEFTKTCDSPKCGCLIHNPFNRNYELKDKWYGRKSCKKYGYEIHNK